MTDECSMKPLFHLIFSVSSHCDMRDINIDEFITKMYRICGDKQIINMMKQYDTNIGMNLDGKGHANWSLIL
jgi:hypothetical protein